HSGVYARVIVLHRTHTPYGALPGVEERVTDFAALAGLELPERVDDVYCCVGTTQKAAGTTEAFQKVDRGIPSALARWAAAQGARVYVTLSSVGANARAASVYLRTKGEMEHCVTNAGVPSTYILRPSLLAGQR